MSTQQPEALRLADAIRASGQFTNLHTLDEADAELRRQHARITELESQLAQRFDAADMATASAQGFMDGVASVSAVSEPVAVVGSDFTLYWAGTGPIAPIVEKHGIKVGSHLYSHTSPPEGMVGWWMPIETAPKDGTAVLVYPPTWDDRGCSTAQYDSDKHAAKPRPYWSRDDTFGKVLYSRNKPPTHWMPMPPAPGPADGESNG